MDEKNKKIIRNSIFVFFAVVMFVLVSYAVFSYAREGEENNKLSTGTLILTLDDSTSSGITLSNAIPVTDQEGLSGTPYTFTVRNSGTLNSNYELQLVDDEEKYISHDCSDKKLPWTNIKYSLTKNDEEPVSGILNNQAFDTALLKPEETNSYTLRLWIDSKAGNEIMGTHFHGKIQVKAIQEGHTNYDTGA